jgi:RimJ/RimL family protein N-acetyltransferase
MIYGKRVLLRSWHELDISTLAEIRNDAAIQQQLLTRSQGSSLNRVRQWLESYEMRSDKILLVIADSLDNQCLGFLHVTELSLIDRHAKIGICIVEKRRGHGVGGESLQLIHRYLLDTWGIQKVNMYVREDNVIALKCYKKEGYNTCGTLRKHFLTGENWYDVVILEKFL